MYSFKFNDLRNLIREALGNAYRILGVSPGATPEEIKAAYRRLAIQLHPDKNPGTDTTAKMAKANVAYGILSDPKRRSLYDRVGDRTVDDEEQPKKSSSGFEDFVQNAWRHHPNNPQNKRPNSPPPKQPPHSSSRIDRRFVYDDTATGGKSKKFWHIIANTTTGTTGPFEAVVRWGRVGTLGQRKTQVFPTALALRRYINSMIESKLKKGYKEVTKQNQGSSQASPPPPKSKPQDQAPRQKKAPPKKTTYKIYGRRGNAPVHTRYAGKVYAPTKDTQFRSGDSAQVGLGTDGRLSVHNPSTGRTQVWDTNEAVQVLIDEMVAQFIVEHIQRIIKT